ncbi:MAG: Dabb family protein [Verrucomicrobia bacterium]|nr:Dabb family protein [Verrucomicrobiota bacterium]
MARTKHIVLLKFKDGTAPEQIEQCFNEILELSEAVPGIDDYVAGPNTNPESMNHGFTHAFIMTFADGAARDAYLAHDERARVRAIVDAHVDKALSFDFEV